MICKFCGYDFPDKCGTYGCPNCNGEGLKDMTSEREMRYRAAQAERGQKMVRVWVPVEKVEELKAIARQMREDKAE